MNCSIRVAVFSNHEELSAAYADEAGHWGHTVFQHLRVRSRWLYSSFLCPCTGGILKQIEFFFFSTHLTKEKLREFGRVTLQEPTSLEGSGSLSGWGNPGAFILVPQNSIQISCSVSGPFPPPPECPGLHLPRRRWQKHQGPVPAMSSSELLGQPQEAASAVCVPDRQEECHFAFEFCTGTGVLFVQKGNIYLRCFRTKFPLLFWTFSWI